MNPVKLALGVLRNEGLVSLLSRSARRLRMLARLAAYRARARLGLAGGDSPVAIVAATLQPAHVAMLEAIWPLAQDCALSVVVPDYVFASLARLAPCSRHPLQVISYSELAEAPQTAFQAIALERGLLHRLPLEMVDGVLATWKPALEGGDFGVYAAPAGNGPVSDAQSETRASLAAAAAELRELLAAQLLYRAPSGALMRCHYSLTDMGIIHEVHHGYLAHDLELDRAEVIVDIGANIGAFSVACALLSPRARIYAYEPCPDNFELLEENVARNCPGRVEARPLAVYREAAVRTLYLDPEQSGGHTLYGAFRRGKSVTVECVSLTSILAEIDREVDVLKIDAEGAEYDMLFSCGELLARRVRTIVMEVHRSGRWTGADMVAFLERHGFTVQTQGDPNLMLLHARSPLCQQRAPLAA